MRVSSLDSISGPERHALRVYTFDRTIQPHDLYLAILNPPGTGEDCWLPAEGTDLRCLELIVHADRCDPSVAPTHSGTASAGVPANPTSYSRTFVSDYHNGEYNWFLLRTTSELQPFSVCFGDVMCFTFAAPSMGRGVGRGRGPVAFVFA